MTYTYSKESGWLGFCDYCDRLFKPKAVWRVDYNEGSDRTCICSLERLLELQVVKGRCIACSNYPYERFHVDDGWFPESRCGCDKHSIVDGVYIW
jgi:hypothetical protein